MEIREFAWRQDREDRGMTAEEIEAEVDEHLDKLEDPEWEKTKQQCEKNGHDWHGNLCWTCFKEQKKEV